MKQKACKCVRFDHSRLFCRYEFCYLHKYFSSCTFFTTNKYINATILYLRYWFIVIFKNQIYSKYYTFVCKARRINQWMKKLRENQFICKRTLIIHMKSLNNIMHFCVYDTSYFTYYILHKT